jgi:hypothetical protein
MARAGRRSFPRVLTVYLTEAQDGALRAYAERHAIDLCTAFRRAVDQLVAESPSPAVATPPAPPAAPARSSSKVGTPADARAALQASARQRQLTRAHAGWAPPPSQRLASGGPASCWRPPDCGPPDLASERPPLAWTWDGEPFEPPRNAVAWLVLELRYADRDGPTRPVMVDGQVLCLELWAPFVWLVRANRERAGVFRLILLDAKGRVLRAPNAFRVYGGATVSDAINNAGIHVPFDPERFKPDGSMKIRILGPRAR